MSCFAKNKHLLLNIILPGAYFMSRRQEAPAKDLYETEIARFARTTPKVLAKQNTSGLSKDDMLTSMAQLKLLREKVGRGHQWKGGQLRKQ